MTLKLLAFILPLLLSACTEQRAVEQFNATVDRLCVTASPTLSVDQHLRARPQGCAMVKIDSTIAAGLDEVGLEPGVYRTQAASLGLTAYRDDVLIARLPDTLVFMTPAAFTALAKAAGTVHEARAEEMQLQAGRGVVILGSLLSTAPADQRPLPPDAATLIRKTL